MIHEIDHNGEKLPLKLSYGAFHLANQEEASANDATSWAIALFYYALVSGHKAHGRKLEISREDAVWLWEDHTEQFNKIMEQSEVLKAIAKKAEQVANGEQKKTTQKTP